MLKMHQICHVNILFLLNLSGEVFLFCSHCNVDTNRYLHLLWPPDRLSMRIDTISLFTVPEFKARRCLVHRLTAHHLQTADTQAASLP